MADPDLMERLRQIGRIDERIVMDAEVLQTCETMKEVREAANKFHWGSGDSQFVFTVLNQIMKRDPSFRSLLLQRA